MTVVSDRIETSYDVKATAKWIRDNDYARVALQLPDEALRDAADLARALERELALGCSSTSHREVFVLADTTFGSCCVDEVAAAHRDASAVVHYGRACCSPTSRTPARFVFFNGEFDVEQCANAILAHAKKVRDASACDGLICVADQEYFWALPALREAVKRSGETSDDAFVTIAEGCDIEVAPNRARAIAKLERDGDGYARVGASRFRMSSETTRENSAYVWIGVDGPAMTHAMLVLNEFALKHGGVGQYDPRAGGDVRAGADGASETARALKRRRYLIARAKEARVVGIVAGTLGVSGYREVIADLRRLIANSGRKSYTVVAGKPNPQKLANFPEIEVFIMVSCELTALMDGREYMRPIITPYEATIAFTPNAMWMGEVKLDFASVPAPADAGANSRDDAPEFSLISGAYHTSTAGTHAHDEVHSDALTGTELARRAEGALAVRAVGASADVTSGAEYLISRRSYTGLDPGPRRDDESGELIDASLDFVRGLSGRAREYATEHLAQRESARSP